MTSSAKLLLHKEAHHANHVLDSMEILTSIRRSREPTAATVAEACINWQDKENGNSSSPRRIQYIPLPLLSLTHHARALLHASQQVQQV